MRKRSKTILLRFTPEELAALNKKVAKTNLTRESYCRHVLNDRQVRQAPPADFPMLIRELRGVSSLLEEALYCQDLMELREAAERCFQMEKLIWDTFTVEG